MITRTVLFALVIISAGTVAHADDYAELIAQRDSLQQQIAAIDSEIARCEKSAKTWKTATIIGSVGAVASGIGIIAQTGQVNENKKTLNEMSSEYQEAKADLDLIQRLNK